VQLAHAAASPASLRVVARAAIALVLVALMSTRSAVLDELLSVAVKTAAAEFGVERIEDLDAGADLAEFRLRRCIEMWLDVVLVLRAVPPQGQYVDVDNLEVLDDELADVGAALRVPPFVDLVEERVLSFSASWACRGPGGTVSVR